MKGFTALLGSKGMHGTDLLTMNFEENESGFTGTVIFANTQAYTNFYEVLSEWEGIASQNASIGLFDSHT